MAQLFAGKNLAAATVESSNAVVRFVDADGRVTTLAGTDNRSGYQNGPCAQAPLGDPRTGNLLVANEIAHQ